MLPGPAHTPALPVVATLLLQPPRCALVVHPPIFLYSRFRLSSLLFLLFKHSDISHYLCCWIFAILHGDGTKPRYDGLICGQFSRAAFTVHHLLVLNPGCKRFVTDKIFLYYSRRRRKVSRAPRSRSGLPAFNRATPPHLPFFYPAAVPLVVRTHGILGVDRSVVL